MRKRIGAHVKSAIIYDGLFKVFESGEIHRRNKDGLYVEAAQNVTCKNGKYKVVTSCFEGKQKHHYVHRLVAEAFLLNPNGYTEVNHKDGNGHNNTPLNLEWCTHRQNVAHAHKYGLINMYSGGRTCKYCGYPTMSKRCVCQGCRDEPRKEFASANKLASIHSDLLGVNTDGLSNTQTTMVNMRNDGKTFSEIAASTGVTRQYVQQFLKNLSSKKAKRKYIRRLAS